MAFLGYRPHRGPSEETGREFGPFSNPREAGNRGLRRKYNWRNACLATDGPNGSARVCRAGASWRSWGGVRGVQRRIVTSTRIALAYGDQFVSAGGREKRNGFNPGRASHPLPLLQLIPGRNPTRVDRPVQRCLGPRRKVVDSQAHLVNGLAAQ